MQAIEARDDGDGLVNLKASGFFGKPDVEGTWNLIIDPNSGYLVRSASFASKSKRLTGEPVPPYFVFTSMGTKWSGGLSLAEEATCLMGWPKRTTKAKIKEFKPESNKELLADLRNRLRGKLADGTRVKDYRVDSEIPFIFQAGKLPMTNRDLLDVVSGTDDLAGSGKNVENAIDSNSAKPDIAHVGQFDGNTSIAVEKDSDENTTGVEGQQSSSNTVFWVVAIAVLLILAASVCTGTVFMKRGNASKKTAIFRTCNKCSTGKFIAGIHIKFDHTELCE